MQLDAVVVAAGTSTRFGTDKLLADLCGVPVLARTLQVLEACPSVDSIVAVVAGERQVLVEGWRGRYALTKLRAIVPGGARRRDSVEAGLASCRSGYVAIQDGARPLITPALVEAVVKAAEGRPGAIAAIPVTDTIKEVAGGAIRAHPDRDRLWAAQTPQVVLRQAWLAAAAASDGDETDDAAMLSRLGLECTVAEGDPGNIKITRPLDLAFARAILAARGGQR